MVRVAADDLDVIQAAIETLGGQPLNGNAMTFEQRLQAARPRP
jgi:hypothetical protein